MQMESLLKALDDMVNQINDILAKGGSDWVVKHQQGMAISWELTPALAHVEAELSHVDMNSDDFEPLLEHHITHVFHLDMNKLSSEERQSLVSYVSGYIEAENGLIPDFA